MKSINLKIIIFLFLFSSLSCEKEEYIVDLPCDSNTICIAITDPVTGEPVDTVYADGTTIVKVAAYVPKEIKAELNNITFTSATGTFVGETNATSPEVSAVNGVATVLLQVGTVAETYRIEASVSDGTTKHKIPAFLTLKKVPKDEIIAFDFGTTDLTTLEADGETIIRLKTSINYLNPKDKKLELQVNGGWSFANHASNQVEFTLNDVGEVECFIKVGQTVENCFLIANFEGYQEPEVVSLLPASPDNLNLHTSSTSIPRQNGTIDLTSFLSRNTGNGKVSEGIKVAFQATQDLPNGIVSVGTFNPPFSTTDSNEMAKIVFITPSDTTISKDVPIQFKSWVVDNPFVADSISIQVQ